MLVLTAPARIRKPTITTKHSITIFSQPGPIKLLDQAVDQVVAVAAIVALDVLSSAIDDDLLVHVLHRCLTVRIGDAMHAVSPLVAMVASACAEVIDFRQP